MGSEREDFNSVRVALVSMKAILACVPVFILPFALKPLLRPGAELFVVGWGCVSAWFRPPYLYVVLNVVIVTLGVKSGALTTSSTSDRTEDSDDTGIDNSANHDISKAVAGSHSDRYSTPEQDNVAFGVEEGVAVSQAAEECGETQLVSYHLINEVDSGQITSSVRKGVTVSQPAEECGETQRVSYHLINEVDSGQVTSSVCNEEKEEEEILSAELYEKSETFIGNFYRELKLQRID